MAAAQFRDTPQLAAGSFIAKLWALDRPENRVYGAGIVL
ncbi:unnamed protein product, partial [marine sediment metagenome]